MVLPAWKVGALTRRRSEGYTQSSYLLSYVILTPKLPQHLFNPTGSTSLVRVGLKPSFLAWKEGELTRIQPLFSITNLTLKIMEVRFADTQLHLFGLCYT